MLSDLRSNVLLLFGPFTSGLAQVPAHLKKSGKKVTACLVKKNFSIPIIKINNNSKKGISIQLSKEFDVDFLEKELKCIESLQHLDIRRSHLRRPQVFIRNVDKSYDKESLHNAIKLKNEILNNENFKIDFSITSSWSLTIGSFQLTPKFN
ncbi:hypothetical protein TNCV_2372961 [Trichonephila clavipes]|nr:hypothetical protein TNCV_2372961 [Trichonephila clavipes]